MSKQNCTKNIFMLYIVQKFDSKLTNRLLTMIACKTLVYTQDANICSCAQSKGENTVYVIRWLKKVKAMFLKCEVIDSYYKPQLMPQADLTEL